MNQSIARLFLVVIVLFTVLIVWTSRWTVIQQKSLQTNALNKLDFYASLKVKRGRIFADNGAVLARSVKAGGGTWTRRYPFGPLFSQVVGYAVPRFGEFAGLERYRSQELTGTVSTGLGSVFGHFSSQKVGDDVYTNLDPTAQHLAQTLLAGRAGSVVALDPRTGAVKVMYSNPTYNDNQPTSVCLKQPGCSLLNGATQGEFPPGSTFKIVTTTAALDSGKFTPQSIINGDSPINVSGIPLHNDADQSWGPVSLTKALTYSINTVYAQVGEKVGRQTMATYMKRFGFYSTPPLDYPSEQMIASGERVGGNLVPVTNEKIDLGRTAIGQANLAVTPLQMAMVVATVANGGTLMQPRLVNKVVNADGQLVEQFPAKVYSHVMKPSTAQELTKMMTDVVEEGTGTPAQLEGVQVAGKTGTATVVPSPSGTLGSGELDDAWFVGFAPVSNPQVAVAVELSRLPNGYGGTYAAPIAAQVIKTLLAEHQ